MKKLSEKQWMDVIERLEKGELTVVEAAVFLGLTEHRVDISILFA
jgi:hypothetical protein